MAQANLKGLVWEAHRLVQHEKNEIIGHFGARLADSLFPGGEVLNKSDPQGDILHPEYGYMEVKMSSSRRQPIIDEDQLFRHFQSAQDGYHYLFIRYGNPSQKMKKLNKNGNRVRKTLLNKVAFSPSQVTQFLAERVTSVFLIDISIILAIWSCDPVRSTQSMDHERERVCINVPVRDLRLFASGSIEIFSHFGLDVANYSLTSEEISGRVGRHIVETTLYRVVKKQPKIKDLNLLLDFGSPQSVPD